MSRLGRDPLWLILAASLLVGLVGGDLIARFQADEGWSLFGHAWIADTDEARAILTTMFGLQLTVLTIVLSLNAPMIQSAANQYSPRLVPFYLKHAPIRQAFPLFVLAAAYDVAAIRRLGLVEDHGVRPQVVLSGAIALVVAAFCLLAVVLIKTFRFLRVERVLALVRESSFAAAARLDRHAGQLPLVDRQLVLPEEAAPIRARASGYLVSIDAPGLYRLARRMGLQIRISRMMGDYLDAGEVVGWAGRDPPGSADESVAERVARRLTVGPVRTADLDPFYGLRILADVAARALSTTTNDAYTSRQALHQIRSVLRRVAQVPLGDWNLADTSGVVRVSIMAPELREYVSAAIEAPLRLGAGDPDVLDGVLEVALEIGLVAPHPEGRALAYQIIARVLQDATDYGNVQDGRLERLLREVELVRASLERDVPRPERHLRFDWALATDRAPPASTDEARP